MYPPRVPMKRYILRLFLVLTASTLAAIGGELWVRSSGQAKEAVRAALYYQSVELELHRGSEDPSLHYTLRPGARSGGSGPYGPYTVSVGPEGDRGPTPPGEKELMVFGASTVFGAGVSDDETLPAALGRALSEATGQRVRARNFGVSAYVLPQMAAAARQALRLTPPPDHVLIVHTNPGRRPFLLGAEPDPLEIFEEAPEHWAENFPPPPGVPEELHTWLLQRSAIYQLQRAHAVEEAEGDAPDGDILRRIAEQEIRALEAEAEALGVPLTWVIYPDGPMPRATPDVLQNRAPILLHEPDQPRAFYDLHPPPEILEQHARTLAAHLLEQGL